jgi:hypothetical protein
MSCRDELHVGKLFFQCADDPLLLPFRVQMCIDLVDQDDGRLLLDVLVAAMDLIYPLEQSAEPSKDRARVLADFVDPNQDAVGRYFYPPGPPIDPGELYVQPGREGLEGLEEMIFADLS